MVGLDDLDQLLFSVHPDAPLLLIS
jgi:hypothetical protein